MIECIKCNKKHNFTIEEAVVTTHEVCMNGTEMNSQNYGIELVGVYPEIGSNCTCKNNFLFDIHNAKSKEKKFIREIINHFWTNDLYVKEEVTPWYKIVEQIRKEKINKT